ncbi:hypothetical protein OG389_00225 [Streptomyces sp. NBC_00435]|uniref:hypothetical protein n=1 Tax=Streptomyces sp. NBC_00435 TaxID=2903649 RepID=UPI002E2334BE
MLLLLLRVALLPGEAESELVRLLRVVVKRLVVLPASLIFLLQIFASLLEVRPQFIDAWHGWQSVAVSERGDGRGESRYSPDPPGSRALANSKAQFGCFH